jgi:hypothetical protein
VAVGLRAHDPDDSAIGAGNIFDDDRLAKRRPHVLTQQSCNRIEGASRRQGNDERDGARRIVLRACNPEQERKPGSTGKQLKKIAAEKFHVATLNMSE